MKLFDKYLLKAGIKSGIKATIALFVATGLVSAGIGLGIVTGGFTANAEVKTPAIAQTATQSQVQATSAATAPAGEAGQLPPGQQPPGGGMQQVKASDPPSAKALTTAAMKTAKVKTIADTSTGLSTAVIAKAQVLTLKKGTNTITKGGVYRLTGTVPQGQLVVKVPATAEVTLILDKVQLTSNTGPALWIQQARAVTIALEENTQNSLTTLAAAKEAKGALHSEADLTLQGKGSLSVDGRVKHGIAADDSLTHISGQLSVTGATDGIHVGDYYNAFGGSLSVKATSDAIDSEGSVLLAGGSQQLKGKDDGISALGDVLIKGGTLAITEALEGLESKQTLTFTGGQATIQASDDGLNAKTLIDFAGGTQSIKTTKGDAIDSNGKILVRAGNVTAIGGAVPEGGIDNDTNVITVTGGTLLAVGGHNSLPDASTSKQLSIAVQGTADGETLAIQSGGKTLLTYKATSAYSSLVYTAPDLNLKASYQVLINGKARDSFTADKTLMAIGVTGGMPGHGGGKPGAGFPGKGMPRPGQSPTTPTNP